MLKQQNCRWSLIAGKHNLTQIAVFPPKLDVPKNVLINPPSGPKVTFYQKNAPNTSKIYLE